MDSRCKGKDENRVSRKTLKMFGFEECMEDEASNQMLVERLAREVEPDHR